MPWSRNRRSLLGRQNGDEIYGRDDHDFFGIRHGPDTIEIFNLDLNPFEDGFVLVPV